MVVVESHTPILLLVTYLSDACAPEGGSKHVTTQIMPFFSQGREGYIGIGFSAPNVVLNRLPGWESRSFGYHGDDGFAFESSGKGRAFGPTFTTGDTIGVLLNQVPLAAFASLISVAVGSLPRACNAALCPVPMRQGSFDATPQVDRTISYYKDGAYLGVAFRGVSEERLYPMVGMRTENEHIRANFTGPFVTDLASTRRSFARRVLSDVLRFPLPVSDGATAREQEEKGEEEGLAADSPWACEEAEEEKEGEGAGEERENGECVLRLCIGHLLHEGYVGAAAALARESGVRGVVEEVEKDAEVRKEAHRQG